MIDIKSQTYQIDRWVRGKASRANGDPPHRAPIQDPGDPVQLYPLRHAEGAHPYAVQDWDGCEARVMRPVASQVVSGPPRKTRHYTPDPHSLEAYHSLDGTERGRVYQCIKEQGPIACWQVEAALQMKHETASASITTLRKAGLIQFFDEIPNPAGRSTWRYIIT